MIKFLLLETMIKMRYKNKTVQSMMVFMLIYSNHQSTTVDSPFFFISGPIFFNYILG